MSKQAVALSPIESEPISSSTTQVTVPISSLEFEPLSENEHNWSSTASFSESKSSSGAAAENPKAGLSASTDEQLVKLSSLPATTTTRGQTAPTTTTLKPTTTVADPCKAVQCSNNGIVDCEIVDGKAKYQCRCPSGFYGENCQCKCKLQFSRLDFFCSLRIVLMLDRAYKGN